MDNDDDEEEEEDNDVSSFVLLLLPPLSFVRFSSNTCPSSLKDVGVTTPTISLPSVGSIDLFDAVDDDTDV